MALAPDNRIIPCTQNPDRWATAGPHDAEAKALCRGCPRRWLCAKEAVETPGAEGMWSAVYIPKAGRGRTFAFRQLRALASHGGYHVND
ncbi:WhiB family transcriptional regulator [Mycobacterium sp.]|jgi:WhiB family redox-sensing transcriptional regulator|uniref:WhiB family transcriptional regulator n=1 Tax=Mycobacterium sp. TaxID=1785 RepID=UPI002D68E1DF|nr:WhiB family transcriptional regulator [Mycobacterium sp.]HZA08990.1 WhiB family transcriptional regulator [Mycobacterium sp.]